MAKGNPFRFSTKLQDDETDLVYYGYRYYTVSTGTWLSADLFDDPGFQSPSLRQAYLPPYGDPSDPDSEAETDRSEDDWRLANTVNPYQFCFGNGISRWDLCGLVPQGATFFSFYLNYEKYKSQHDAWMAIGGNLGPMIDARPHNNSCAARVSAALAQIPKEHIPNKSREYINSVPPKGIPGNYIVNAKLMNRFLTKQWGAKSECSKTAAYYFKSKTKKGDFAGLLREIAAVIAECKCGGDFVAVVSSVVRERGVSGHVGVVTPKYHDSHTPYGDSSDVWLLPPTLQ